MKERVSALMDGELHEPDVGQQLARLKSNSELRRAWDTYHLIGDALRGTLWPALAARFSDRLASEPTVLAPRTRTEGAAWFGYAAAASVAGVALVAWLALPGLEPAPPRVAQPLPPAPQTVTAPPQADAPVPVAVGVENYLLAHQRFSPTSAMQGVVTYARAVTDERGRARR